MLSPSQVDEERYFINAALATFVTHKRIVVAMETHVYSVHCEVLERDIAILTVVA